MKIEEPTIPARPNGEVYAVGSRSSLSSILTLASWRLRQTWWQLLLTGLALLGIVTIACLVPLFSAVATSASLQETLGAEPLRSTFALDTRTQGLSTAVVNKMDQLFDPLIRAPFGSYLDKSQPPLVIQLPDVRTAHPALLGSSDSLALYATSIQRLQPDLTLVQGNWPSNAANVLDIMATAETASSLHLSIGEQFTLAGTFTTNPKDMQRGSVDSSIILHARLAGTFEAAQQAPPALFGENFQPVVNELGTNYTFLVPADPLLAFADQWATSGHTDALYSQQPFELTWYYHLDATSLQASQVGDLTSRLSLAQQNVGQVSSAQQNNLYSLPVFPYVLNSQFYNPLPQGTDIISLLQQYTTRVALVKIPILVLAIQIALLLLFFTTLLLNMLIDRQVVMNAVLSSRGASPRQVFWPLVTQGFGLCLLALLLGPALTVALIGVIARVALPAAEQGVVALTIGQTGQVLALIVPYISGVAVVCAVAIYLTLRRTVSANILELRRESTRSNRQPLWLRYYVDVLAGIVALSGFGVSLYLAGTASALGAGTQDLLIAPLTLLMPFFLLLAGLLFFLRFFPLLLRFFAWCTRPTRGASGMLAFVQTARSPRSAIRMTMLLTLALAFAFFVVVFDVSQAQRAPDVASYESGADFRGNLPTPLDFQTASTVTNAYMHVPGVLSATVGLMSVGDATGFGDLSASLALQAVDARTFARTAIWSSLDSSQSLTSLMQALLGSAKTAEQNDVVPVIADESTMNQLNLSLGDDFSVDFVDPVNARLTFQVVAAVTHIPGVDSDPTGNFSAEPGGMIADYTTLKTVFTNQVAQALGPTASALFPLNYLWLRTSDDSHELASVRAALNSSRLGLSNLYDRREIISELQSDPLYVDILLLLSIGGATALILALIGDLVASWLSVRARRNSFVVLRALGANSRHIAALLTWEQVLVYLPALALGALFGFLLATLAVPTLIFTGLPATGAMSELDNGSLYLLQQIVPVQVLIPLSLRFAFGGLAVLCALAIILMVRAALRPLVAQELRLNED